MGNVENLRKRRIRKQANDYINEVMSHIDGNPSPLTSDQALDQRQAQIIQDWNNTKQQEVRVMEKLYTPDEVADYLKLSPLTVRDFLRASKIKGIKVGKEWRIKEKDLQAYVDSLEYGREEQA